MVRLIVGNLFFQVVPLQGQNSELLGGKHVLGGVAYYTILVQVYCSKSNTCDAK